MIRGSTYAITAALFAAGNAMPEFVRGQFVPFLPRVSQPTLRRRARGHR